MEGKKEEARFSFFLFFLPVPRSNTEPAALEQQPVMSQKRMDGERRRRRWGARRRGRRRRKRKKEERASGFQLRKGDCSGLTVFKCGA